MRTIYFFCIFIGLFNEIKISSQPVDSGITILKVHFKNDTLSVLFMNKKGRSSIVPVLEYRISEGKKTLYNKFYHYSGDTLTLDLKKEIDKDLYSIRTSNKSESSNGRLYYIDKKLNPRRKYWTSVRLSEIKDAKVLVIKYEGKEWNCLISN